MSTRGQGRGRRPAASDEDGDRPHQMGTCVVETVLDGEFRVKGIQDLRVCDARMFPEPVGCDAELSDPCVS